VAIIVNNIQEAHTYFVKSPFVADESVRPNLPPGSQEHLSFRGSYDETERIFQVRYFRAANKQPLKADIPGYCIHRPGGSDHGDRPIDRNSGIAAFISAHVVPPFVL
jgi:hypothetical protein